MKYQSELIKEIVDNRGHETSSLHYESECIEAWIDETKGAYPKLCDYQSEWLNYIVENPIGKFPYKSVVANPTVTVENVVPYSYKSAILKGQTLVNLNTNTNVSQNLSVGVTRFYRLKIPYTIVANKPFTLKLNVKDSTVTQQVMMKTTHIDDTLTYDVIKEGNSTGYVNKLFTKTKDVKDIEIYVQASETGNATIENVVLLEGDHTDKDIPYFTGMQSVQMPVLTTTGKNLFDIGKDTNHCWQGTTEFVDGRIKVTSTRNDGVTFHRTYNIPVKKGRTYLVNVNREGDGSWYLWKNGDTTKSLSNPFTVDDTFDSVAIGLYCAIGEGNVCYFKPQIEEGTVATSYEPYKSNILTVNEDVELRGIGNVQDTLNCLTGEVTERIGEIVLDGSEDWTINSEFENTIRFRSLTPFSNHINTFDGGLICNNFESKDLGRDNRGVQIFNNRLYISFNRTELQTLDNNGVKQWLASSPTIINYQLAESTVKTVDLTVTNQNGETMNRIRPIEGTMNLTVSGTPIYPTGKFEIPVEAITQNLSSFIEE